MCEVVVNPNPIAFQSISLAGVTVITGVTAARVRTPRAAVLEPRPRTSAHARARHRGRARAARVVVVVVATARGDARAHGCIARVPRS